MSPICARWDTLQRNYRIPLRIVYDVLLDKRNALSKPLLYKHLAITISNKK